MSDYAAGGISSTSSGATTSNNSSNSTHDVDPLMAITPEERDRAIAIKRAIEGCDEVMDLPDFEYVKLAICCHPGETITPTTLNKIIEVAWKLQRFREEYQLLETIEDAMFILRKFFLYQPGLLMDVSYLPTEQCFTSSSDMAKMNFEKLQTDDQWKGFQGGCYYWIRSMETDFTAIRNGIIVLNECEGMSMLNFNLYAQERAVHELWSYYPAKHRESVWLNTPTAANMFYGVIKRIVNKELLKSWKLGGGLDGYDGRLDTLFCQPTREIAQEALLQRMQMFLEKRFHNIRTFSLE